MRHLSLVCLIVLGAAVPRPAAAATILFDVCSEGSLCNILTATTTLNGSAIDVAVTAPGGYGLFGASGANRALGFNVVGSEAGLTVSNLTSGFSLAGTDMNVDGMGLFEYVLNGPSTGSASFLPLTFTVSRTAGFLSDLDLFEVNSAGYIFAAHIRNESTGLTGFTAATGIPVNTPVPEPASMLLLGTGLAAVAAHRRRRRRAS